MAGDWDDSSNRKNAGPTGDAGPTTGSPTSSSPSSSSLPLDGFNAAAHNIVNPSTTTGGTLNLLAASDCDSWDPGRTSLPWCWNLQRLITRTLVGYTRVDGYHFGIGPDLATSLGRHNADYTRWTYTLRPGLRFSTGRRITPADIKYAVERLFAADALPVDPGSDLTHAIAHPARYAGPARDGNLDSIITTGSSITFTLSAPNPDFDYLLALPGSAPEPRGKHRVASGPYEITSHRSNESVVFERNPNWNQSTDDIRHPLVDEVRLTIDPHFAGIDKQLQAGTADARADGGVQSAFRSQILKNPEFRGEADDPVSAVTRYMAVPASAIPNVHCRRAIFYAWDKAAALRVFGGPTEGVPAPSMTPPGIAGYEPGYDPYPSGTRLTGNVAKAEAELRACGKPNGFTTRFAYATPSETGPELYRAEQRALGRVGIRYTVAETPSSFYCSSASPALVRRERIGLLSMTARAEYPTGYGYYHRVQRRFTCLQDEEIDVRKLHDPIVNRVLRAAAQGQATVEDWQALDRAVMASATYLPLAWVRTLTYRNPRLTNVTCDNALASGSYDFVNIGVR